MDIPISMRGEAGEFTSMPPMSMRLMFTRPMFTRPMFMREVGGNPAKQRNNE